MQAGERKIRPGIREVVREGLTAAQKYVPESLLMDAAGFEIFNEIIQLPEYYPGRCEKEISSVYGKAIAYNFRQESKRWNIVEWIDHPSKPDGFLLKCFVNAGIEINYFPVSEFTELGESAKTKISEELPSINSAISYPGLSDFLSSVTFNDNPSLFFFGSVIECIETNDAIVLLRAIATRMKRKDRVILNLDFMKSPSVIEKAYYDYLGVNIMFSKNLLARLNREMDANFDLRQFEYWPLYDATNGACRKYLVSLTEQVVKFPKDNFQSWFKPWETISIGLAQKYSREMIQQLIEMSGLQTEKALYDNQRLCTMMILRSI
jgi:L-histidine Nalpha-methyltransferase